MKENKEKRKPSMTPQNSVSYLLNTIWKSDSDKGLTINDIRRISEEADLRFGYGYDVIDVLLASRNLGLITIDPQTEIVRP